MSIIERMREPCPKWADKIIREQKAEIDRLRNALEGAEEWLEGWMSAEPYLTTIRKALSTEGDGDETR